MLPLLPDIALLFEDEVLFVLNKPSGLHSVGLPGKKGGASVAERILNLVPSQAEVSERPEDAGLINRLDMETSGILLGARTKEAWQRLREQIQSGAIEKEYLVLLDGLLERPVEITSWIGSPYRRGHKVHVYPFDPGKKARALHATTLFEPIKAFSDMQSTLATVAAHTARRHQI